MTQLVIHRPARTLPPSVPSGEVVLTPPPHVVAVPGGAASWLQYLLPVIGGAGALLFVLVNPKPLFVAGGAMFALGSVGMGVGLWLQQRSSQRQRTAADRQRYLDYLDRVRARLTETAARQQVAAAWRHPEPERLPAIAGAPQRVWERRTGHDDFLDVRVGVGPRPLATRLVLDIEDNPMAEHEPVSRTEAERLVRRRAIVPAQPLTIPLGDVGVLSVVGERVHARALVRALVCQLAAFHAPEDLRLAVCAGKRARQAWEWVKWLPHTRHPEATDDTGAARLVAGDLDELAGLLAGDLEPRRADPRRQDRPPPGPAVAAHLVVVVDGPDPAGEAALAELLAGPRALGASLVYLVDSPLEEPGTVDLRARVGPAELELEPAREGGPVQRGRPDRVGPALAEALARQLAPLRLSADSSERILVESIGLPDLLGVSDVAEIEPERTWRQRSTRDFLRVPIGVGPSGEPIPLDLKEAAQGGMGPHGLIVGATGSGKSELLRTLVTGLAMTHPPELLALVLVDFKGGATFTGMADLPHVAGVITNLEDDLALVDRMHAALFGEQRRRQELLRGAGNLASVREYRALRATDPSLEPLPSLLIVVDEFSELLASRPDFIDLFVAIGRLGRSLGMHLLLASQRLDEGRLRGLESHLSYRIGLRTFSAMESRIVLGVPDAYELPPVPGSGYLKVDTTVFDRFKAAMVSSPYRPPARAEPTTPPVVTPFPAANRTPATPVAPPTPAEAPEPAPGMIQASVMDVAVARLKDAAPRVHQVWLPPLEPALTLDSLLGPLAEDPTRGLSAPGWPGTGRLAVPLGVVDKPLEQAKGHLVGDFQGAGGHLAVVGAPQSGKSNLLRTLLTAFLVTHTPAEVQFYCLDFGGGLLAALEAAPHVGTVTGRLDPERVRRVVQEVHAILEDRERRFLARGIDSAHGFRARRAAGELPEEELGDVFLVIDNWPAVRLDFEDLDPLVVDLASRGLGYGVHLVLTANRWMDIRPNLRDSIGGRLELRLGDPLESVVDRREAQNLPADVPGRGLTLDKLHFQAALPRLDGRPATGDLQAATDDLVRRVAAAWPGRPARPVRVLPTRYPFEALPVPGAEREPGVPIGVGESDLEPVYLDLGGPDPHLLVFGDGESGKTGFLRTFLGGLTARCSPEEARVVMVDYRRTLLDAVGPEHLLAYVGAAPAASTVTAELAGVLASRLPGPDLSAAELRARSWWRGAEAYVVVDDYDLVVTASGNPLLPLLEFLPQARDLGFHLILARRVGGAARAMYEPLLQRVRELGSPGLLLSGDPQEGPVLGPYRATLQVPGRGLLVRRQHRAQLVQVAWLATSEQPAPAPT